MAAARVSGRDEFLSQALIAMQSALDLLDRAEAPSQIGARLDHAICELQETIGTAKAAPPGEPANSPASSQGRSERLRSNVERQPSKAAELDSQSLPSGGLRDSE